MLPVVSYRYQGKIVPAASLSLTLILKTQTPNLALVLLLLPSRSPAPFKACKSRAVRHPGLPVLKDYDVARYCIV